MVGRDAIGLARDRRRAESGSRSADRAPPHARSVHAAGVRPQIPHGRSPARLIPGRPPVRTARPAPPWPEPGRYPVAVATLLDLFDTAVARFDARTAVGLRNDDGSTFGWSYRELDRRSRLAAWRLRALGLEPNDRILT